LGLKEVSSVGEGIRIIARKNRSYTHTHTSVIIVMIHYFS